MNKLIILMLSILMLSSCDMPFSKKTKLVLDNPTDKEINVLINSNEYTIPSEENLNIKVNYWDHEVTTVIDDPEDEEKTKEIKESFKTNEKTPNWSIINPTLSDYVVWNTYYSIDKEPIPDEYLERVNIDWIRYEWFIKKTDDVLIENSWDYDLDTDEPDQIEVTEWEEDKILSKIWRAKDFSNEYFRRYPNERPE